MSNHVLIRWRSQVLPPAPPGATRATRPVPGPACARRVLAWALATVTAGAAADSLRPGSDSPACGALRPGATAACPGREGHRFGEPTAPTAAAPGESPGGSSAPRPAERRDSSARAGHAWDDGIEREVDEYLLQHGKPPRSAVRALLDPSDENIAALQADQARRETVAAYVAQRLTELQENAEPIDERDPAALDVARRAVPFLAALRFTAIVPADCDACAPLFRTLRLFARANPVADLRLVVVGADAASSAPGVAREARLPVPVSAIAPDAARAIGIHDLPALLVQDLRSGRRIALPAAIDAEALREAAVALRRTSLVQERP